MLRADREDQVDSWPIFSHAFLTLQCYLVFLSPQTSIYTSSREDQSGFFGQSFPPFSLLHVPFLAVHTGLNLVFKKFISLYYLCQGKHVYPCNHVK